VVGGTWAARIPAVQERLGLSDGALGAALLGLEGGAVIGLPLGGALVAGLGSRSGLRIGFAVWPVGLVAVAAGIALPRPDRDAARPAKPTVGQEKPMTSDAASTVEATVSQPSQQG
jgi:hypothetical protein